MGGSETGSSGTRAVVVTVVLQGDTGPPSTLVLNGRFDFIEDIIAIIFTTLALVLMASLVRMS